MDNRELASLVRRSQSGEQGAMEELLRAAYTPVSYQCRRFLKNGQDAEDMTQEILLLLYTKLDTLEEPEAFWGWLSRMTANRCKNAITRTHADLPLLEDEEGHSILDSIESEDRQLVPEAAFDNAETARMIGEIVDALPQQQRTCVLLYYYDEMSVKEIAGLASVSENTVKSRLNYARKTIKENVLAYEKKHGIRLHSLSPIPFLFYFLCRDAEQTTDSAAAHRMAGKVMAQGASTMGKAIVNTAEKAVSETAGNAAVQTTAKAAGQVSAHAIKGLSVKMAAAIAAGFLAVGGAAVGIVALVGSNKEEAVEIVAETEDAYEAAAKEIPTTAPPADEAATGEPETPEEETEDEKLFNMNALAPAYTGDVDKCVMTDEQAEAFAAILDSCISESMLLETGMPPFCRAALFDAGGGIPALFVAEGYDMSYGDDSGYMPNVSKIYCWDGGQAVPAMDIAEESADIMLTEGGLLLNASTGSWQAARSELYVLEDGMMSEEPVHVYERFFFPEEAPTGEECQTFLSEYGHFGDAYDYSTLTLDKWRQYQEYEEEKERWFDSNGWQITALDGTFLSVEETAQTEQTMAWHTADWELGHGMFLISDVSHYWKGNWTDAGVLADMLRKGAAVDNTGLPQTSVSTDGSVRRTTADSRGYNIEIFYETPVLDGPGTEKINVYFQNLQERFLDPEGEGLVQMWEVVEENPPLSEGYRHYVTATVNSRTDKYVSVTQCFSTFLGGTKGSEYSYHNFRMDTGEALLLTDILDGTEEEIKAMAVDAFATANPGTGQDALENIRSRNIEEFDFYITDGRVYVCFSPYDIYGMLYGPELPIEIELQAGIKAGWE